MAEVTEADMPETNFDQPAQPVYLEIKDTPPPDQGENYPTQAESKPEPEAQPQAPQDPVADQQPTTHEPETKDDTSSSQTDHVETLTPAETNTNLIQDISNLNQQGAEVGTPSEQEQVFPTAQTKMVLPTLSRDVELVEEQAQPMLVAMDKQPAAVTPGTMQQNMLNLSNKTAQIKQEDYLGQQREDEQLNNIDLHAVNQEIDLLNKYYPGLGQVIAQPIQQMLPVTSPVNTGSQAVNSSQHKIEQLNQGNQDVLPEVELPINQQQSVLNAQTSILGHPIRREHGTNIYADRQRREYIYPTGWALGQTSEGEETSGKGPGTINGKKSARIDRGGRSYGSSQITEANMPDYLKHSRFRDEFKGMKVNSKEFNETWIRLGKEKPEEFRQDQHDYIQRTHYESLISNLRRKGIDIADRGPAIKDMLWSTAVQYGSNSDVIENALQNKNLNQVSNEEIITAVQEYKKNNVDRLFRRLLQNIRDKKEREEYRQSLINRASREKSKLLKLEKQSKPDWINK